MAGIVNGGEQICSFMYSGGFLNCSPSWASLLGYSQDELASMSLENVLVEGSGMRILQAMKFASMKDSASGEAGEQVDVVSCDGSKVSGMLYIEWTKENKVFYGSFTYIKKNADVNRNMIYEYVAETSLSGMMEYDEYSNIISADRVFENYFGLKNITGSKTYSFSNNPAFVSFLKSVGEAEDCVCINLNGEKLIALVEKTTDSVSLKIYNKHFLMKTSPGEELASVLNTKRIWDKLPMMVLIDSENKTIVDANSAAAEFYGYRIDEFKNMPVANVSVLPSDIIEQELTLALSGKKKFFISRHRTAGGQIKDVNYNSAVVAFGEKRYLLSFVTDITRRKTLEKVIEEKNVVLMELNLNLSKMVQESQKDGKRKEEMFLRQSRIAAVGEIVSSVSDYWKEPLNTVALLVQDLEDAKKYGELDEKYIDNMVKTVMEHLEGVSHSIDICTKIFKNESEEELFDIRGSVLGVSKIFERRFLDAHITFCCDCACINGCVGFDGNGYCMGGFIDVLGHINDLKHAVYNILINSMEAILRARQNGILLGEDEGLIFARIKTDGRTVSLSFRDNGGGIEEELAGKVFDPYFSTKDKGMGIGLYIAKQLVEKKLKGRLSFENIRDGAMVTITLICPQNRILAE